MSYRVSEECGSLRVRPVSDRRLGRAVVVLLRAGWSGGFADWPLL